MSKKSRTLMMAFPIAILLSTALIAPAAVEGMDKEFRVESGGTELYIRVRGHDIEKPVLLFLHGGPGEVTGPLVFQAYAGTELEKHFMVGYLHQRHTCMSPEAPLETHTLRQFVEDVDRVVAFLKDKFKKEKIFLLGHSFGGILGYLYCLEHEGNIKKMISAGGAFSTISLEESGYQTVLELAKKANNQDAVKNLIALGPPPFETIQEGMAWRMLGMSLLAGTNENPNKNLNLATVIANTGIEKINPYWMMKAMTVAGTSWKELSKIDLEEKVRRIGVPLLLITGAKDVFVPFRILEKGYQNYGGPKEHVRFENSSHTMFVDETELFVSKVIEFFQDRFQ